MERGKGAGGIHYLNPFARVYASAAASKILTRIIVCSIPCEMTSLRIAVGEKRQGMVDTRAEEADH